jgi:uncharacterized protein DUF3109
LPLKYDLSANRIAGNFLFSTKSKVFGKTGGARRPISASGSAGIFSINYITTALVIIQDILVSEDVLTEHFACQLNVCKGACCWEGDFGAPLEAAEVNTLAAIYGDLKPFLRPEGIEGIEATGVSVFYEEMKGPGTPLLAGGACAFLNFEENGTAKCGIEKAFEAGVTDFRKPISCHLYPVRVAKNEEVNFEALNYDRWDICSAACAAGEKARLPVFRFVKEAIERKYGEAFYEELEAASGFLAEK